MARTPVTTDPLQDLANMFDAPVAVDGVEVRKLKRTPVTEVDECAYCGGEHPNEECEPEPSSITIESSKPLEIKPIIDGYRECARPDCNGSFKPRSLNPKEDDATEYYCSSDCAIHEFYRKRNLGAVPEKIVSSASMASNRAHREEKKRERVAAAPERDAKYGPMRKVIEVLGETKTAKKVKLECGHITTSRGDQQRCRKCRVGRVEAKEITSGASSEGASSDKKVRPSARSEKSSARRATRANHQTKPKRTPVKPPKRGKKGKR